MGVIVTDEAVKSGDGGDIIFGIAGVGEFDRSAFLHFTLTGLSGFVCKILKRL